MELRCRASSAPDEKLAEKLGHAHDAWVKIGRAIEWLDWGERGFSMFRDWSAQNAQEFDERGLRAQWASFNRNRDARGRSTTIATVYMYAMKFGWSETDASTADAGGEDRRKCALRWHGDV